MPSRTKQLNVSITPHFSNFVRRKVNSGRYSNASEGVLIHNTQFWREFITKAVPLKMAEPQVWDFKETLAIWHAEGSGKAKARLDFAQDIAAFANARGGILVVGVVDEPRHIVGVGSGKELKNWLQFARAVIADQLDYSRDLVTFKQVASTLCLVIVVAQACQVTGVNDGNGGLTYPVRLETLGIGILAALALTRLLKTLPPMDPATYVAAPVILLIVALLAAFLPTRRAIRVDPVDALRQD